MKEYIYSKKLIDSYQTKLSEWKRRFDIFHHPEIQNEDEYFQLNSMLLSDHPEFKELFICNTVEKIPKIAAKRLEFNAEYNRLLQNEEFRKEREELGKAPLLYRPDKPLTIKVTGDRIKDVAEYAYNMAADPNLEIILEHDNPEERVKLKTLYHQNEWIKQLLSDREYYEDVKGNQQQYELEPRPEKYSCIQKRVDDFISGESKKQRQAAYDRFIPHKQNLETVIDDSQKQNASNIEIVSKENRFAERDRSHFEERRQFQDGKLKQMRDGWNEAAPIDIKELTADPERRTFRQEPIPDDPNYLEQIKEYEAWVNEKDNYQYDSDPEIDENLRVRRIRIV
jgi:hypothetical protein